MNDDPNDTLTNMEAKVLCLRYGIKDIDEHNTMKKLRSYKEKDVKPGKSFNKIAKTLGKDKNTLKSTEINALRKLNITN